MNNVAYKIKQNIVPFFIAAMLFTGICCAWYYLHPSSPYFKHVSFVVRFEKVGTLSPGNRVAVRGIACGKILKVELTDEAVYVTAEVSEGTRIPRNSQFRLITAGLMGERELNVLSGDSKDYVAAGDTVKGFYEEGASGITKGLREIMAGLREIKAELEDVDTLVVNPMTEQANRVGGKAKNLGLVLLRKTAGLKKSLEIVLQDCEGILSKARGELDDVSLKGGETAEKAKELLPRVEALLQRIDELKSYADEFASRIKAEDNSVGLILAEKGKFAQELERTAADIDALMSDIKKDGLKLNVDIF